MIMKEEALKLADELDALHQYVPKEAPDMIRRLVEELDKPHKYDPETGEPLIDGWPLFSGLPRQKQLSDEELMSKWEESKDEVDFTRAIEERRGIK